MQQFFCDKYLVCEDAYKDGVKYIEIRFSPILHMREGLSLSSVMEAVVEGCVMAELNMGITARIIVCGMRQMSSAVTLQLAQIAWRYQVHYFCMCDTICRIVVLWHLILPDQKMVFPANITRRRLT